MSLHFENSADWWRRLAGVTGMAWGTAALANPQVVINEIYYNPDPNPARLEFIELTNAGDAVATLSGWKITEGVSFEFPAGTTLEPGAFLLVAESPEAILSQFSKPAVGPWTGSLDNQGDHVELRDATGTKIDEVDYGDEFPWPVGAAAGGKSMELIHPQLDNDLGLSWRSAAPTPGTANSVLSEISPPQIRQVDHTPRQPLPDQPIVVTAKVTDPNGVRGVSLSYQIVAPGAYVPAYLPKTTAVLRSKPNDPLLPNPAYSENWQSVAMRDDGTGGDAVAGDSVFTAVLPGQPNRTLVRYRLTADDSAGASVTVPLADDPSLNFALFVYAGVPDYRAETRSVLGAPLPRIYSAATLTSLPVYHLITRQADYDQCVAYTSANQIDSSNYDAREAFNWPATFVYNERVYDNMRYRLRQRNDRYGGNGKRSFRFRFNDGRYVQFHDRWGKPYPTKWRTLNSHKMSARGGANWGLYESMNNLLWNLTGTPAPHNHWFHFRVVKGAQEQPPGNNGQNLGDFYGALLGIEDYDVRFLDGHDLARGNLYRLQSYQLNGLKVMRYQSESGVADGSDYTNILNKLRPTQPASWLDRYVNWPAHYRYKAVVDMIRHYDVQPNTGEHLKNRAWYFEPVEGSGIGRLWTLPWDSDTSWGPNWNGGTDFSSQAIWGINRAAPKPEYIKEYRNVVRAFRDLVWQDDQISPAIDELLGQIRPFSFADRDRWTGSPSAAGNESDGDPALRAADMKKFAFIGGTWEGGIDSLMFPQSNDNNISGKEGRDAFLDWLQTDAAIPATPTITYTGAQGYPVGGLQFASSPFSDPDGDGTFGGMEWRVSEFSRVPIVTQVIADSQEWKYWDRGDVGTAAWKNADFDDQAWATGQAEFGFGDPAVTNPPRPGQVTEVGFGGDPQNKHMTYYFRKSFSIDDLSRFKSMSFQALRDDGVVIYLNGSEIWRNNLPAASEITLTTPATASVPTADEYTFRPAVIIDTPGPLHVGTNVIAAEVHLSGVADSDMSFDFKMNVIHSVDPPSTGRFKWEWTADWESGELAAFTPSIDVPASAVRPGFPYRARVRHKDATGRWSHWSAPVAFTSPIPDVTLYRDSLVISEIMYHPSDATADETAAGYGADDFEFIELLNVGSTALDLTNVRFTKGIDFDFAGSAITLLSPGARVLVVRDQAAFEKRYGSGLPVAGAYRANSEGSLSNSGELLRLSFGAGIVIHELDYRDEAPWPVEPDGLGSSLVLIHPEARPDHADPAQWRPSRFARATPSLDDRLPMARWKAAHDVAAVAADDDDDDNDGIPLLLEYVLGLDPAAREPNPLHISTGPDGAPRLSLTRALGADEAGLSFEFSSDLADWRSDPAAMEASTAGLTESSYTQEWRMNTSPPAGLIRFVRVRAVR